MARPWVCAMGVILLQDTSVQTALSLITLGKSHLLQPPHPWSLSLHSYLYMGFASPYNTAGTFSSYVSLTIIYCHPSLQHQQNSTATELLFPNNHFWCTNGSQKSQPYTDNHYTSMRTKPYTPPFTSPQTCRADKVRKGSGHDSMLHSLFSKRSLLNTQF